VAHYGLTLLSLQLSSVVPSGPTKVYSVPSPPFAGAISGLFEKGISFDLALSRPSPLGGLRGVTFHYYS
jgi:hypothetical protein